MDNRRAHPGPLQILKLGSIAETFLLDHAPGGGAGVFGFAGFAECFLFFTFFGFWVAVFGSFFIHLIGLWEWGACEFPAVFSAPAPWGPGSCAAASRAPSKTIIMTAATTIHCFFI